MMDVITIGSALQDIFLEVAQGKKIADPASPIREHMLAFGLDDKISVQKLHRYLGGGAINNVVVFSRLGLTAAPYTQVGQDSWGDGIIKQLQDWGVDTSLVHRHDSQGTGLSVLLHDVAASEHLSFNYKGASDDLDINRRGGLPAAKWLQVSALTGKNWRDDIKAIADLAKDMSVAWNPGSEQRRAMADLDFMLPLTEVLLVNKEEAVEILKVRNLKPADDMRYLLSTLQEMGPRLVVITEGKQGASVYDGTTWFKAPIVQFDVKDTTGAGDTFGATFVAGLIKEHSFSEALKMAMKAISPARKNS